MSRYIGVMVRSIIIPVAGTAVMFALSEEPKLFLWVILWPFVISLPLMVWSMVRIVLLLKGGRTIDNKLPAVYGCSLAILAVGLCFSFLFEAMGGHGSGGNLFVVKCLFALGVIFAYPFIDLLLLRYSYQSASGHTGKATRAAWLVDAIAFLTAVVLLVLVIGPPLNAALRLKYFRTAGILVSSGADIQQRDRYGCTPLWYAVHRVDPDMAALLLNKGAKLDVSLAGFGLTRAVEDNRLDMLRLLLGRGADPNATYMGATPLVHACRRGNVPVIRLLLDSGANINVTAHYPNMPYDGKSPLDVAKEDGSRRIIELLYSRDKMQ